MYKAILKYVPNEWKNNLQFERVNIDSNSEEYQTLKDEIECVVRNSSVSIREIIRIQDVYSFGQFLIRSQLLAVSGNGQYYTVRRFMKIPKRDMKRAITYNLDYRRCSFSSLVFSKTVSHMTTDDILVVVQFVTNKPNDDNLVPNTFLEYYIEYIVTF